jgi:hypothetical protein
MNRLRSASFHAFWIGAVLIVVGTRFLHEIGPDELFFGRVTDYEIYLVLGLCFLGLISSFFSLISGVVVWVKHGQACPWIIFYGVAPIVVILFTLGVISPGD